MAQGELEDAFKIKHKNYKEYEEINLLKHIFRKKSVVVTPIYHSSY